MLRRFDVFAVFNYIKNIEKGMSEAQAKGDALWLAKHVAGGRRIKVGGGELRPSAAARAAKHCVCKADPKPDPLQGIQVDLRIVPRDAYGAGLLFFTGSADFNIRCRARAKECGWHLTRYGLQDENGKIIARSMEKDILDALGIGWLEPKDRNC